MHWGGPRGMLGFGRGDVLHWRGRAAGFELNLAYEFFMRQLLQYIHDFRVFCDQAIGNNVFYRPSRSSRGGFNQLR